MLNKIYKDENGKLVVKVPVSYVVLGDVELTFDSVTDMRNKLSDPEFIADMPLGDNTFYVEDSYEIDHCELNMIFESFNEDDNN